MKEHNLVSSAMLQRVFKIHVGNIYGTGFIVENENKKFLVTAKHLFEDEQYPETTTIKIDTKNGFEEIDNKIKYSTQSDVAVIETSKFNSYHFEKVNYDKKELILSQEVFMLGFPYGNKIDFSDINNGFPLPLVKHGIISGFTGNEILIDWDNNEGFSGGPVIYRKLNEAGFSEIEYIGGIIKGYILHPIESSEQLFENSGIGIATDIQNALEVINEFE